MGIGRDPPAGNQDGQGRDMRWQPLGIAAETGMVRGLGTESRTRKCATCKRIRSRGLKGRRFEKGGNSRPLKIEVWAAVRTSLEEALMVDDGFREKEVDEIEENGFRRKEIQQG